MDGVHYVEVQGPGPDRSCFHKASVSNACLPRPDWRQTPVCPGRSTTVGFRGRGPPSSELRRLLIRPPGPETPFWGSRSGHINGAFFWIDREMDQKRPTIRSFSTKETLVASEPLENPSSVVRRDREPHQEGSIFRVVVAL